MAEQVSISAHDAKVAAPYVLVVDDDRETRNIIRIALERVGYEIESAASAEDGLVILEQRRPDAIIVDLIMPGMSGDEFARRCMERWPGAPLIFVSGYDGEHLRSVGITQVVFIPKPISLHDLRTMLGQLLAR
jgi:CheY-like chemotaxis protein